MLHSMNREGEGKTVIGFTVARRSVVGVLLMQILQGISRSQTMPINYIHRSAGTGISNRHF